MNTYILLKNKMPSSIKKAWIIKDLITFFISIAVIEALRFFAKVFWHSAWINRSQLILILIVTSITVFSLILIPYKYFFHRYEINQTEVAIQTGFFFRKTIYIPLVRIQHIEASQGPILRLIGLTELSIHTAASTHHLSGLDIKTAADLRAQILELVEVIREDV
ncbi:PH domain-containing protein [Liquorilactobacillus mali]|uniref:PH domain-containing protein n=1 Tax=Liquorilactobacillus mali TaxID=1618 RepID=UPI000704C8A9|nr:PH domain-containing protein [Liquorilactobacillus mali]